MTTLISPPFRFLASVLAFSLPTISTPLHAANQVWSSSAGKGDLTNFSGDWDLSTANWSDTGADTGRLGVWQSENIAFFGGDGSSAADPDGEFTVTLDDTQVVSGVRQIKGGSGNFTLTGGALNVIKPNGIRADRGVFTINSPIMVEKTLILYLFAIEEDAVLVLGGDNVDIKSGSVTIAGNPGTVRLTNANALGQGHGSLELLSDLKSDTAATLDINGLSVKQGRTLVNTQAGAGMPRLVNENATQSAEFQDGIQVRENIPLGFGGSGAGLELSGAINGTGVLATVGTGAVTLSFNNSYSGGTLVASGSTLYLEAAASATGTGAVTIQDGGALETKAGKVEIPGKLIAAGPGSGIAPGAKEPKGRGHAAGKLILKGGLDLAEGGTFFFDLGNNSSVTDQIVLAGGEFTAPTQAGTVTFEFNRVNTLGGSYTLIDFGDAPVTGLNLAAFKANGVPGVFRLNGSKLEFSPSAH